MPTATTALVTTPIKAISSFQSSPSKSVTPQVDIPPSPGTFRHPRITEIIKRQSTSSLSGRKIQTALINILAIIVTFVFYDTFNHVGEKALATAGISSSTFNTSTLIFLSRLLFVTNVVFCLRPVLPYLSRHDEVEDIPLTPSQRILLGLAPSNQNSLAFNSGSAGYVTPPRYRRDGAMNTTTSREGSPLANSAGWRSTSATHGSTALNAGRQTPGHPPSPHQSQSPSAREYRRASGSQFAASPNGIPLLYRAVRNDLDRSNFTAVDGRSNVGTSASVLGMGQSLRERSGAANGVESVPGTPSPSSMKRQQGVNYKWLYDKGAKLPRSESAGL